MKTRFAFILLLLSLSTFSFAQDVKDDVLLKNLIKRMTAAQVAYDPVTLDKIYAADYIEISPVGEVDPRDKVLGFYKPEGKPDPSKMTASTEIAESTVRNYGNFALTIVRLDYSVTMAGKAAPPCSMRAMVVFHKEKGEWKIASVQYTGIRPPRPDILDKKSGS